MNKIFNNKIYRPCITVEEKNSLLGKKIRHKDGVFYGIITEISNTCIYCYNTFIVYEELLETCVFEDGSPCGIEEINKTNSKFNLSLFDLFTYPKGCLFLSDTDLYFQVGNSGELSNEEGSPYGIFEHLLNLKFKQVER